MRRGYPLDVQLHAVEELIGHAKKQNNVERASILSTIATDLRSRMAERKTEALTAIIGRIEACHRNKTANGYATGALIGVAEEVMGRWPVVKQALEKFEATDV